MLCISDTYNSYTFARVQMDSVHFGPYFHFEQKNHSVIFQGAFFQTTVSSLRLFSLTKMNVWGSRSATRKGLTVKYSDEPR